MLFILQRLALSVILTFLFIDSSYAIKQQFENTIKSPCPFGGKMVNQSELDKLVKDYSALINEANENRKLWFSGDAHKFTSDPRFLNLCKANLHKVSFHNKNLSMANFRGAEIIGVKFKDVLLLNIDFEGTMFRDVAFIGGRLNEISFVEASLDKVDFVKGSLFRVNFKNSILKNVKFSVTVMQSVNFIENKLFEYVIFQKGEKSQEEKNLNKLENIRFIKGDLRRVKFIDVMLDRVFFSNTTFVNVDFSDVKLHEVDFQAANFKNVIFREGKFEQVKFNGSMFRGGRFFEQRSNFGKNIFDEVDFSDASLQGVNFENLVFKNVKFEKAVLDKVNFNNTIFNDAYFNEASLLGMDFSNNQLQQVNFSNAVLQGVDFYKSDLTGTNMGGANLRNANLRKAVLTDATVIESDFTESKLENTIGLLKLNIGNAQKDYPTGLFQLRNVLWEGGHQKEAREITYLFKSKESNPLTTIGFEWTTLWGMEPKRAILAVLIITIAMGFLYWFALLSKRAQLFIVKPVRAMQGNEEYNQDGHFCYTDVRYDISQNVGTGINYLFNCYVVAMYFSFISSTHLGWRDVNIGSWIKRLQKQQFTYQPRGWLRTVSGVQSLVCIYLIVIWLLTEFSLFFEW